MKTIIEFSDEEKKDARIAMHAVEWALIVVEVDEYLRSVAKYTDISEASAQIVWDTRTRIRDLCEQYHVCLSEIE